MFETFDLSQSQVIKRPTVSDFTLPSSVKNSSLDWENSVGVPLTKDRMVAFVPSLGIMDGQGNPRDILTKEMSPGIIITDQNKVLVMESEPTGGDTFGWTAYLYRPRRERKAFLVGSGTITASRGGGTSFRSSVNTVYDNIPGSPGCKTEGSVSGTLPTSGGMGGMLKFEIKITID